MSKNHLVQKVKVQGIKIVSVRKQQNMIEFLSTLYREHKCSIDELKDEMNKSRRTIFRMIEQVDRYSVIVKHSLPNSCIQLYFNRKLNEKKLDSVFEDNKETPLVYLFLKSLIREIKISEIQTMFDCSEFEAKRMRNLIFDTTAYGDMEYDEKDLDDEE